MNEAFKGLSKECAFKQENWVFFARSVTDKEIIGKKERGEAIYSNDAMETVASDCLKNDWSIQSDTTGTVANLKSHLWPGFIAYHRCNTNIFGHLYIGDGICNENLAFMV